MMTRNQLIAGIIAEGHDQATAERTADTILATQAADRARPASAYGRAAETYPDLGDNQPAEPEPPYGNDS